MSSNPPGGGGRPSSASPSGGGSRRPRNPWLWNIFRNHGGKILSITLLVMGALWLWQSMTSIGKGFKNTTTLSEKSGKTKVQSTRPIGRERGQQYGADSDNEPAEVTVHSTPAPVETPVPTPSPVRQTPPPPTPTFAPTPEVVAQEKDSEGQEQESVSQERSREAQKAVQDKKEKETKRPPPAITAQKKRVRTVVVPELPLLPIPEQTVPPVLQKSKKAEAKISQEELDRITREAIQQMKEER